MFGTNLASKINTELFNFNILNNNNRSGLVDLGLSET